MPDSLCARLSWSPQLAAEGQTAACAAFGLMALYLWFLPVGHTIAVRNLAFFSLIFLTLWSAWRYRLRLRLPLALAWLPYVAVALLSLTYAIDPVFSLGQIKSEIGYGMLALMLAASWVQNIASLGRLIVVVIAGDAFLVGVALFKAALMIPFWEPFPLASSQPERSIPLDLYGVYNGVGNFSTYLVTVMPLIAAHALLLPREWRVERNALFVLLACNVLALYFTGNRMGLIALAAEMVFAAGFWVARQKRAVGLKWIMAAVAVLAAVEGLVAKVLLVRSVIDDSRLAIWSYAIDDILARPWTGGGFGRTVMAALNPGFHREYGYEHAHNMVLNKGVQMGWPGIVAFLFLLGMTLRALWPRKRLKDDRRLWGYALAATTLSVGVFLKNMTDDFFVEHNALLYWALVGAVLGALAGDRERRQAQAR